jgi:hypothetical protein
MHLVGRIMIAAAALGCCSLLYAQPSDSSSASSARTDAASPVATRPAKNSKPANSGKKDAKSRRPLTITPEREAAVLTFVQRNHDELADLLGYLKTSQPEEYERAVKEIFRTTERLEAIRERDPVQYELEIAAWTAQSQVQLLAAKLKMNSSDELLKQLRDALRIQNDAKLTLLKHDRQKVADRLTKIDSDIARFGDDRDSVIDRQLKLLVRTAGEGRPKTAAKGSAKAGRKTP